MQTQAVIFEAAQHPRLGSIELPTPGSTDLLVRTACSAISAETELAALTGSGPTGCLPCVPGSMAVGEILEAGTVASALGYLPGGRVTFCRSRLPAELTGDGSMGCHLAHAIVDVGAGPEDPGNAVRLLPPALAAADAVLLASCAVAMQGIELARIRAGQRILIAGVGLVGIFALQVCRLAGARMLVTDRGPQRLMIAAGLGADHAVQIHDELAAAVEAFAPGGVDVLIDTTGQPPLVNSLLPLVTHRGSVVFQGRYPDHATIDIGQLTRREATVHFPDGFRGHCLATAMGWASEGWISSQQLVSQTVAPAEAPRVYAQLQRDETDQLGILFDWRA